MIDVAAFERWLIRPQEEIDYYVDKSMPTYLCMELNNKINSIVGYSVHVQAPVRIGLDFSQSGNRLVGRWATCILGRVRESELVLMFCEIV